MFIVFAGYPSDNPIGAGTSGGVFDSIPSAKAFCELELMQHCESIEIAEVVGAALLARLRWNQYGTGGNSGWLEVVDSGERDWT